MGLLPAEDAALITGDTPGAERDVLIENFKAQRFRYLVNVAVLTTGFDAPHVDLIAILRPTESVSLYQQIVGRGLRLAPGKTDCLILDYAGNPHDLYAPEVGTPKGKRDNVPVQVFCPAGANNVTSVSVLKIARNVTRKTILPPAAAANVTPYWLIRTIC